MEARPMAEPGHTTFDPNARFVRLREVRTDGFVEFEFAIGEPGLFVDLIMPLAAYHEFCSTNHVTVLAPIVDAAQMRGPPGDAEAAP
jgi:phenol/toluene 2-monooxygenase (NADH) P0/A0